MATNIERFQKDLDALIEQGESLKISMMLDLSGKDQFRQIALKDMSDEDADRVIKNIPNFKTSYEEWYSETLALLKQLLPDRLENFKSLYEKPKFRKSVEYGNYVIQDYMQNLRVSLGSITKVDRSAAQVQFDQQVAILKAAKKRFKSSIFEIAQLVQADLFDSEIAAARELHKCKFYRAAGALAGVVIERHLKQVCSDHNITIKKKNPSISDLNQSLRDENVIDVPQWRFIQHLADIRNLCDHDRAQEPTVEQVNDLLDGAAKILKTVG